MVGGDIATSKFGLVSGVGAVLCDGMVVVKKEREELFWRVASLFTYERYFIKPIFSVQNHLE